MWGGDQDVVKVIVVEAKILEIGSDEIKYKEFHNLDGPIYVLETDRIKKIVFENGTVQKFQDSYKDAERYAGQLNKAIKLNFLSPLYGYTEIGFEKSLGVGKGYEVSLGIIGLGKSEDGSRCPDGEGPHALFEERLSEMSGGRRVHD